MTDNNIRQEIKAILKNRKDLWFIRCDSEGNYTNCGEPMSLIQTHTFLNNVLSHERSCQS